MSYPTIKRLIDLVFAGLGLLILSPFFALIALFIVLESRGGIFYRQVRVGKNGIEFRLFKFRSMYRKSEEKGLLTIGSDNRITRTGKFIRRFKLDELPQLINVFSGEMSLVGPRPEVPSYVEMYTESQRRVLNVRPGITDLASIKYYNENELLGKSTDPEKMYVEHIMPDKLALNMEYLHKMSFFTDVKIIFRTLRRIFVNN